MSSDQAPEDAVAEITAATPIGVARLSKLAFDGTDLQPLWRGLIDKFIAGSGDAAALMDLAVVEQIFGNAEAGLARQADALGITRLYRSPSDAVRPALRLLAFAAAGDIGSNTPLEFLVQGSDIALTTLYVIPGQPLPAPLPDHDLAFVAVGEADEHHAPLREIAGFIGDWPRPALNAPERILMLSRERLWPLLAGIPGMLLPPTIRLDRARLEALDEGEIGLDDLLPGAGFPLIARPTGSHAGRGLAKLETDALSGYLAERREASFYLSPFIDYRNADGLFRKYRIVFIDGQAYAAHMAIADHWMIHYLNAGMHESAAKRHEEAQFLGGSDGFIRRHAPTLQEIAARIGLDYFIIDCAEMPDGALLLFEADIAAIVHDMDRPDLFPYKGPQMRRIFAAFCAMLRRRAGLAPSDLADAASA